MVLGRQSMRLHYSGIRGGVRAWSRLLSGKNVSLPSKWELINQLFVALPSMPCYTWVHMPLVPTHPASCWPLSRPNGLAVTSWSGHDIRHCGLSFLMTVALISDLHS